MSTLDLLAVDLGCELQERDGVVAVLELMQVAELATDTEHPLGRFQDLQDLAPSLVRLEQHRTAKGGVLVEQFGSVVGPPSSTAARKRSESIESAA